MSKSLNSYQHPNHQEISTRALHIYEAEGRPHGKANEHWLRAEAQLIAERKPQTVPAAPKPARAMAKSAAASTSRVSKRVGSTLPLSSKRR